MIINKIFAKFVLVSVLSFFQSDTPSPSKETSPILILNMENRKALPKNFRMSKDPIFEADLPPDICFEGLTQLNASASGQFSKNSLKRMLEIIPSNNVFILDLRQESHGFINGHAISWYGERDWANKGKTYEETMVDEQDRLNKIRQDRYTIVHDDFIPIAYLVNEVQSEEELVQSLSLGYTRLPITDHLRPTDADVDTFINLIKTLPAETWIHFHCAAGRGRSTSFFVMYDMMLNAKEETLENIIKKHSAIGGKDLLAPPAPDIWKYPFIIERQEFLKKFYQYCQEVPDLEETWTSWITRQPVYSDQNEIPCDLAPQP